MRTKSRNLLIAAAGVMLSVIALGAVAAQDATSTVEPPAANSTEQMAPAQAHPFLGVALQDSDSGVTVAEVVDGSAAANAGIMAGDVITAVNGTDVKTVEDVRNVVNALNVGDQATIDLTRNGAAQTVVATLGAQTNDMQQGGEPNGNGPSGRGGRNGNFPMFGFQYNSDDQTWTVSDVPDNSPLYTAGLRDGDVIKTVDGKSYDPQGLIEYLQSLDKDATVTLSVDRDGTSQDITVNASDLMPLMGMGGFFGNMGRDFSQMMPMFQNMYGNGRLGVQFETINADVAAQNNLTVTDGALIMAVEAGTPAETAGLKVNDIVTAVNGEAVDAEHTLRDRMIAYEPDDTVTLTVLRDGQSQDIQATLDKPEMPQGMFNIPFNFGGRGDNGGSPFDNMATPEAQPNA